MRFEYECVYPGQTRSRRRNASKSESHTQSQHTASYPSPSSQRTDHVHAVESASMADTTSSHQRSLEANSGAAFMRRRALQLDPNNAPRMHMFAWNAFMGLRNQGTAYVGAVRPIKTLLSEAQMRDLAATYLVAVGPIYGFMDKQDVEAYVVAAWSDTRDTVGNTASLQDAVLCGVAALGLLFSQEEGSALESDLVDTARVILDQIVLDVQCMTAITAWTLRVAYLRISGSPHKTWMASCVLMHMIEAAGLHFTDVSSESVLHTPQTQGIEKVHSEQRRRLLAVAQLLNMWTSFDIGRSHVKLRNAVNMMPSAREGDYTLELMELLPYSAQLDPEQTPDASALQDALSFVFSHTHTPPPSVLAQTNLGLCLFRRLQSMNVSLTGRMLDDMLALMAKGIRAAQANLDARHPWHHVANVPFQIICVLLSIDTVSVASLLTEAMQCLSNVAAVYNTEATREAMRTASLLVLLHKRWRERAASDLGDVLDRFPVVPSEEGSARANMASHGNMGTQPEGRWLNSLEENMSNMQHFDIDQFFNTGLLAELDGYVFQDV